MRYTALAVAIFGGLFMLAWTADNLRNCGQFTPCHTAPVFASPNLCGADGNVWKPRADGRCYRADES